MAKCPHPEKVAHATEAAALKALASLEAARGIDVAIRAYPCCGHWHLGHPNHGGKGALRRALADGKARSQAARRKRRR